MHASTTVGMTGVNKIDVKLPKIGGIEQSLTATVSHTRQADDDLVFNQQWDRCWFINTNTTDQGLGMFAGRAARGVGGSSAVKLTMRINPFQQRRRTIRYLLIVFFDDNNMVLCRRDSSHVGTKSYKYRVLINGH